MITLKAKTRIQTGEQVRKLRERGKLPAVLYGPGIKQNLNLEIDSKEFVRVFQETGRTSFVQLEVEKREGEDKKPLSFLALIHDLQKDPLTLTITHVDFYQPLSTKEIKVMVPLVFEGEALAVKNLGGTLVKNIQEVQVQALPQNLPHEIRVDLSPLDEIDKTILVKDLHTNPGVKILKNPEEIVAHVMAAEKIEEERAKPIEEKVEQVEKSRKKRKEKLSRASKHRRRRQSRKPRLKKKTKYKLRKRKNEGKPLI